MKTKLTLLLMLLFTTALGTRAEKVGYTVLSEDGKTLTYYYDDAQADKVGTVKGLGYHEDRAVTKVIFDESFAEARPTSTYAWFRFMSGLQEIVGMENLNTSNVKEMSSMFYDCSSLTSLDVSHFDTSNVTYMSSMFSGCSSLTSLDVSHFDTSKVKDMSFMFRRCRKLTSLDVSHFDTSNVTAMNSMFYGCNSLTSLDVSHFDTSNVTAMGFMFASCQSLTSLDVSHFDTSNVTGMSSMGLMFAGCSSLTSLDVSNFDMSKVEDTANMFQNCSSLETLSIPSSMSGLSEDACEGVGTAETPCLLVAPEDFDYGVDTTGDYFQWKSGYFKASAPEAPEKEGYTVLSEDGKTLTYYYDAAKTDKVGTIKELGYIDNAITKVIFDESFAEASPTSTSGWFFGMTSLQEFVGMQNLNTSNVTDMNTMFLDCRSLTNLDVSHFDTSNVENMSFMFRGCRKLTSLDLSHFDTSNVKNMNRMFDGCYSLTSLDVSHFDTSNVKGMSFMFASCQSLTSLDVSHFDTSNVTGMSSMVSMFAGCSSLASLDVSNFDMSKVEDTGNMFQNCSSLETLSISSSMSGLSEDACEGVGTAETPCLLVAPEDFDYGVDTTGDYFQWKSGYFKASAPETPEKEGYTVLSEDGKTLTYYYDAAKADKVGTIKELGYHDKAITKVIFDESFAEARPTSTGFWFDSMTSLREIVGMANLNTSEVTDMSLMFYDCSSLTSLDLSSFDTSKLTSMSYMFQNCSSLLSLDVSHFDTSNVKDMMQMFMGCSSLTSLDVSNFDLSNLKIMSNMFRDCSSLTSLDLSSFDTSNVTNMGGVFYGCSSLTSLDVSNFDLSNVDGTWWLFRNCSSLKELSVSSSMSKISEDACTGVGSSEAPCTLIAPEGFDYGMDTTGDYFQWKSGYFKVENAGGPVIAELTLDENAVNEIPENGTLVQTVSTMRTLVGGVWNTLCLPFTVSAEAMADESHPLQGATIMTLTDALFDVEDQAQHLKFSQESEIKAGVPYVVKVAENVVNPTFSNVTIEAQEPVATQAGDWRMVGIYSPYTFTAADNGIFFLTSGNKFSYVAQPGTMKGMRAFFALDGQADYANIVVCFDETTGISQVSASPAADGKVYDLQGRSLNHVPAHGVYIINGKKIVK